MKILRNLFLLIFSFFITNTVSAQIYVTNPANCPHEYMSQTCTDPPNVCGLDGTTVLCYDTATIQPKSTNSSVSSGDDNVVGGFHLNCIASKDITDTTPPFCDQNGNLSCLQKSTCKTQNRITTCLAGTWGQSVCSDCKSGYNDCSGDAVCEIQNGTNCEIGGLPGTWSGCTCVTKILKLGPDSVGTTYLNQSSSFTKMSIDGNGVFIGSSTSSVPFNVFGATTLSNDLSMVHNKSIQLNDASTSTVLLIGNYGDDQGFDYGTSTPQTASLAVEGDVKANRLCIKEDCRAEWTDIQGVNYWTASSTNIYSNNDGNVGIGDDVPSNKLSVIGNITGSGSLIITGTATSSNYFASNLGIGGLPGGFWNRLVDLSGSGNSAYIVKTGSINAVVAASDTGTPVGTGYNFTYNSNQMVLGAITNHPINFITNSTSKMFLSNDGKLGIGTTTPVTKLHVDGGVIFSNRVMTKIGDANAGVARWVKFITVNINNPWENNRLEYYIKSRYVAGTLIFQAYSSNPLTTNGVNLFKFNAEYGTGLRFVYYKSSNTTYDVYVYLPGYTSAYYAEMYNNMNGTGWNVGNTLFSGVYTDPPVGYIEASYNTNSLPSGTSGQTLRFNGTNIVADSNLYNNGAYVGIGTTSPSQKIDVYGNIVTNSGSVPSLFGSGSITASSPSTAGTGFYTQIRDASGSYGGYALGYGSRLKWLYGMSKNITDTTALVFYEDGQAGKPRMTIATGGNVGIGTTTPEAKLDVSGSLAVSGSVSLTGPLYTTEGNRLLMVDNAGSVTATTTLSGISMPSGSLGQTLRYGSAGWQATTTIFVKDDGNVGIGEDTPTNKLAVTGNITGSGSLIITGTATSSNYFASNLGVGGLPNGFWNKFVDLSGIGNSAYIVKTGSINAVVAASDSGTPAGTGYNFTHSGQQMVLGTVTNQPLNFITNGTSKMFLSADGKLGVGTTNPTFKLDINGTSRFSGDVRLDSGKNLVFYDHNGTFPTADGGFLWDLNNDSAKIYAQQPSSDNIDLVFKLTDNALATDRFLYWIDDYKGESFDAYPLVMDATKVVFNYPTIGGTGVSKDTNFYIMGQGASNISSAYFFGDASAGNVGIGTTTPDAKLDVNGSLAVRGPVSLTDSLYIGQGSRLLMVDNYGNVSVTSTIPGGGGDYVSKTGDTMTGGLTFENIPAPGAAIDLNEFNIVGVNKLTVTTIDPLYDIGGTKYSTYAPSVVGGVKEEYIGRGQISNCGVDDCSWRLDFSKVAVGSDLWVWRKIVEFNPKTIDVVMTAYGRPALLSYEIEGNQLIFYADRPTEFSYRLIGPRFDWRKWPTLAEDQSEKASLTIE